MQTKVCIICPNHGEFWQKPALHLSGNGCQECFATPKSSTEEFIRKAQTIYGDKYDYSKVDYRGSKTKVCIIRPDHGEWWMTPNDHLRNHRYPGCFATPKHSNEKFQQIARKVHGEKYDYYKVDYSGNKERVRIACPEHGVFWQGAATHLNGNGCSKCSGTEPVTKERFPRRAKEIHRGRYDYSNVICVHGRAKVCISCPQHGDFWRSPHYYLRGRNCPKCVGGVRLTTEEFVGKATAVHEDRYDYSNVEDKNTSTKVCIFCPEQGKY